MLWSGTEAVGTNEVIAAMRGFTKHCTCCRGRVPLADSFQMFLFGTHYVIHEPPQGSLHQPIPSTMKRGVKAPPWHLLPSRLVLPIFITNIYRHVLTLCPLGSWPGFSKVCPHTRARQKPLADVWGSGREGDTILHFICLCAFAFAVRACKLGSVPLRYSFLKRD